MRPRSPSIAPSDSISYIAPHSSRSQSRTHSVHQPATRPPQYPVEVLWTLEDCKDDPDVKTTETNASRPPMERAIRHSDGTMITSGEWAAIKATARLIKVDLLELPPLRGRQAKEKKTKTYFRSYYRKEWSAAIEKMESQQPLLALCAAHWKAEHVLGSTLLVPTITGTGNSDNSDDEPDTESKSAKPNNSRPSQKNQKKRSAERLARKTKKLKLGQGSAVGMNNGAASTAGTNLNKETGVDSASSGDEHASGMPSYNLLQYGLMHRPNNLQNPHLRNYRERRSR